MSKYKVGDKVRVRSDLKHGEICIMDNYPNGDNCYCGYMVTKEMYESRGKVVTITRDLGYAYGIAEFHSPWFTDKMFEGLVEDKKVFTKKDLKNGDVIKKRNGNIEILVLPLGTLVCNDNRYNLLADINDDLTNRNGKMFDIVAVRRPTMVHHCKFDAFNREMGDLVYDRERDTIRELTIEEVEKEFGIKVKRD